MLKKINRPTDSLLTIDPSDAEEDRLTWEAIKQKKLRLSNISSRTTNLPAIHASASVSYNPDDQLAPVNRPTDSLDELVTALVESYSSPVVKFGNQATLSFDENLNNPSTSSNSNYCDDHFYNKHYLNKHNLKQKKITIPIHPKSTILSAKSSTMLLSRQNNKHKKILQNQRKYYDDSLINRLYAIADNNSPDNNTFKLHCATFDTLLNVHEAIEMQVPNPTNSEALAYRNELKQKFNNALNSDGRAMLLMPFSNGSTYYENGNRSSTGSHWTLGVVEIRLDHNKFHVSYSLMDSFGSATLENIQKNFLIGVAKKFTELYSGRMLDITYSHKYIRQYNLQGYDSYICGGIVVEFMKKILSSRRLPEDNLIVNSDPASIRMNHLEDIMQHNRDQLNSGVSR
ncbi:hypothetical protein CAXC1_70058 [Candidatus Xenohaliotis californiensis]|uniref:Ubiquitin-like protease family profile domain-containing protein n=1 Tax=Candidatus Xenohaliotis californiensis TaxID=84677 RepID=A0ABP0EU38_9RICK|nr:hypothetical protein CAXC1_70058 [Candidatus Xenohaliotis californiensis]